MARRLTDDQRKIVETLDRPLFVAAGAGSGKSSTLAERVAWALEAPSGEGGTPFVRSLDEVLVITFTRAAAEEIKEKIRERLREGGMEAQALAVDSAWISTIHGMCSRILRRHAFDLGLDPRFTVLEQADATRLVEQATDEVLRELQDAHAFPELFDSFQARSRSGQDSAGTVFGMVRKVRDAAGSALRGFDSIHFCGTEPDLDASLRRFCDGCVRALAQGRDQKAFGTDKGMGEERNLEGNIAAIEEHLALPPHARREHVAALRGSLVKPGDAYRKKTMKEVGAEVKAAYADVMLELAFADVPARASEVLQIARMVDDRYRLLKAAQGCLDNDDLLARTFAAFSDHPEIAASYGGKFRLVMVDEFQDTNAQQVRMIELLSGADACHLATVGDAQQSIYRFRAADVQVFRDREASLDDARKVRLTMNFRSHADVLAFVERALDGAPLPDFMHLDACPTRPDGYRARTLPRVDMEVLTTPSRGGATADVRSHAMATLLADRIAERVAAGERPQDVALLLGVMRNLDAYLVALRARGIDCVVSGGSTFSKAPEVRMVASLLHVLANPKDTQTGLFPVLVSDLFSLEADDLLLLSTKVQEANGAYAKRGIEVGLLGFEMPGAAQPSPRLLLAHDVLARALERMGSWRIEDVLREVLVESGWAARCEAAGPEGLARLANALAAVRHVGELVGSGGLGPSRAATEFDHWLDESKEGPASLSGGEGGAVKVMTVHASKGLEFPLVAIAECWGSSSQGSAAGVTCENYAGEVRAALVPPGIGSKDLETDEPCNVSEQSDVVDWARHLVTASREGDQAERARLLYVAITRARESVVLGLSLQANKNGELVPRLASDVVGTLFGGALPPLGTSELDYGGSAPARIRRVELTDDGEGGLVISPDQLASLFSDMGDGDAQAGFTLYEAHPDDSLPQALGSASYVKARQGVFSYSSAHALMEAARMEAGVATHAAVAGEGTSSSDASQAAVPPVRMVSQEDEDIDGPEGLDDADRATNLGSAFHELAQTMVEAGADHDPARLDALARHWRLSARQRVRLEEAIVRWERSDIRQEALRHDLVLAEVPFFIEVQSAYGSYVEGAIDLLCRNRGSDEALVVDYKTGDIGLTEQEVYARHEMQANFYAHVMMTQGYRRVRCAFVGVERDRGDGQPLVASYSFDEGHLPQI